MWLGESQAMREMLQLLCQLIHRRYVLNLVTNNRLLKSVCVHLGPRSQHLITEVMQCVL